MQYCLHGRVARHGERIRITLWLMDAAGCHVWGDSYDGATHSLFDLLQQVANSVLCGAFRGITGAELDRINAQGPARARRAGNDPAGCASMAEDRVRRAHAGLAVASRAMEHGSGRCAAGRGRRICQARLFNSAATGSSAAARDAAVPLSARADAFDAGDPLVITARAATATLLGLYEDTEPLVERALAMDPASGWAHERAGFLLFQGKPDAAIAHFGRAMRLHGP